MDTQVKLFLFWSLSALRDPKKHLRKRLYLQNVWNDLPKEQEN